MEETVSKRTTVRLQIHLLGAVEVVVDGRRLRAFDALRLQRFVALIALRQDLRHRARLAFELWPDSDEAQARTNLRKLLHEVRQALPDADTFFDIDNKTIALRPSEAIEVDVWRFRDAVDAGDHELAARLYAGDLLPASYEEWFIDERARLRALAHSALVHLVEAASATGDHRAAIAHAQRIIDLDPTDELAARAQMEAHVALGDKVAALRAYHRCAAAIERELAVAPDETIEALYRQLLAGASDRTKNRGDEPARIAESPIVGREVELHQLDEAWSAAQKGVAHLVLITGESGIGKTRLAQELGRRVCAKGYGVAWARAYEAAGRLPWGPIVDLLRSETFRSQIDTLDVVWRDELARLLPELHEPSRQGAPGRSSDPAQRYRLFDAVSRALAVGGRPRLLIIDDLQWCDAETIEIIGFVARNEQTAPILIVGTVRPEEVPEHHSLRALVDALTYHGLVTEVPLSRLDQVDTATLAAQFRTTGAVDPDLAARLWSETEGNPLFIVEAMRAGFSAKRGEILLTPTIRAVLGARLSQLTAAARRLSEVGAVIGRPFSVDLLAAVTGIAEHKLVDQVDELWRRRIVRDQGRSYDFSHDKLRAVALEMTSPARRRQLHRAVAEVIARDFDEAASPQLAAHYDHAGMVKPAIDAYRVAGTRAVAVSAFDEAVAMFRRALALLADMPACAERDALELDIRIALGSPLVALDGYGSSGAHQLYERALALCHRLERPVEPPILRGLGLARLQGCRFQECRTLAQALLDHDPEDPITVTEGHYLLGVSAFWLGDLAAAHEHLTAAIATHDEAQRNQHLALYAQDPKAVCLVRLAFTILWKGDVDHADETARAALERAIDLDHLMTLWYVLTYASMIAAEIEDTARLAELLDETDRLGRRFPLPYLMITTEALQGWLEVREGSTGGIEKIERSVERSRAKGESLHLTYCLLLLARARGILGTFSKGREAAREALSWSQRHDQLYLEAELWRVDGELAYQGRDSDVATTSLSRAAEIARSQGADWLARKALGTRASLFPKIWKAREQL